MKKKQVIPMLMACLFPFCGAGHAATSGKTGFQFLKLNPSARSAGMAEATAAFVGDLGAAQANPAGLAHIIAPEVSAQHLSCFQDASYDHLAMAFQTERGGWAAGVGIFDIADIPKTRSDASVSDRFVESGSIEAGDQLVSFSWARRQTRNVAVGASVKAAREQLDTKSAYSLLADGGFIYRINTYWRVAGSLQNLGTPGKFISKSVMPPARIRGALYCSPEDWVAWEVDALRYLDGGSELLVGAEANWYQEGFLRLGYRQGFPKTDVDSSLAGFTIGGGLKFRNFRADYAYAPFGDLGESHRISVGWRFNVNHKP